MSSLLSFFVLMASMGIGTLICGLIPLSLPLSRKALRILEVFSAGLLIGAAVTVVIPEGAKALFESEKVSSVSASASQLRRPSPVVPVYSASSNLDISVDSAQGRADGREDWAWSFISKRGQEDGDKGLPDGYDLAHDHDHEDTENGSKMPLEHLLGTSILCGFLLMFAIDQISSSGPHLHDHEPVSLSHAQHSRPSTPRWPEAHRLSRSYQQHRLQLFAQVANKNGGPQMSSEATAAVTALQAHKGHDRDSQSSSSDLDLLPDDYDDDLHASASSSKHDDGSDWVAAPRSSQTLNRSDSSAPLLSPHGKPQRRGSHSSAISSRSALNRDSFRQVLTTLIGLLIHAFADGIAMGASAGSGDNSLTLIVFFAIMVHKAPASFGLCTLLISQKLSKANIRKGVAVFSLAAPLGALTTYALISMLFSDRSSGIDGKHIGIALLFSGGTFLFVAMHATLELAGVDADLEPVPDHQVLPHNGGSGDTEAQRSSNAPAEREVLGKLLRLTLVALGAWTPRLLQKVVAAFGGGHHH